MWWAPDRTGSDKLGGAGSWREQEAGRVRLTGGFVWARGRVVGPPEEVHGMSTGVPRLRRGLAAMLVLIGTGALLGGCYIVPAYGPPPGAYVAPGPPAHAPGRWVWNGYAWVWQPGYWSPPPPAAPPPGAPRPAPGPPGPAEPPPPRTN